MKERVNEMFSDMGRGKDEVDWENVVSALWR